MEKFEIWLLQFIIEKSRRYSNKVTGDRRFITVRIKGKSDKSLQLGSPEFINWYDEMKESYEGLQYLEKNN